MKVICIQIDSSRLLVEGNTYTASQCPFYENGYRIAEIPIDPTDNRVAAFHKKLFVPTSDIDETEMEHNYNEIKTFS